MKKQLCIWTLGLVFLAASSGTGWCASKPEPLTKAQPREQLASKRVAESDPDLVEAKRERFKMLEWVIMQDLLEKYQRIEKNEDLDLYD